ncbi:hypothetical protein WJX73_002286 [Symbiochloris irregularis]|uniref:Battenin n=1 Tax=Symbiochloris irregularis TaxID=706552 RepID=A0AAW1NYM7_9CHLO
MSVISEPPPRSALQDSRIWLVRAYEAARKKIRDTDDVEAHAAFWLLGLLNNAAYVIMLAGANELSSGGAGLVYFWAEFPSILVKASGPYWFHHFSYKTRLWAVAVMMGLSYTIVALSSSLPVALIGVSIGSFQGGLGESSCLGLSALYDNRRAITFWSSGTGAAGVFGYSWVALLHTWGGMSLSATLLLANSTCLAWLAILHFLLRPPKAPQIQVDGHSKPDTRPDGMPSPEEAEEYNLEDGRSKLGRRSGQLSSASEDARISGDQERVRDRMHTMSTRERVRRTLALWPYMVPLLVVYFAEYTLQAGAWTAMGFPVEDKVARDHFYKVAGWLYQAGVFLSRSSGLLYQASRGVLWALPAVQMVLLLLFSLNAWWHFWYNGSLYILCLVVGLIGGGVYVNAFTLIGKEVDPAYREFSLTAASVADSVGITLADLAGVLLEGCLFRLNHLPGALFSC